MRPDGHTAVMAARTTPPHDLDFFPTPPWATRALLEHVIPDAPGALSAPEGATKTAWDPACGAGHMTGVLAERFATVYASDVFDYGGRQWVGSFTGEGPGVIHHRFRDPVDWIVTNPPFALALAFAERALGRAREGVALLVRTAWLEGGARYERLFRDSPPAIVAPFVERVPMVKGRWDPDASTATAYAWFVWRTRRVQVGTRRRTENPATRLLWIPPGCRRRLEHPDDRRRYAASPPQ